MSIWGIKWDLHSEASDGNTCLFQCKLHFKTITFGGSFFKIRIFRTTAFQDGGSGLWD